MQVYTKQKLTAKKKMNHQLGRCSSDIWLPFPNKKNSYFPFPGDDPDEGTSRASSFVPITTAHHHHCYLLLGWRIVIFWVSLV
jgi:hypothetical protein